MTEKKRVGRPRKAAQTEAEAIHMVLTGNAPRRGRNEVERAAMSKGRNGKRGGGRPINPQSKTQQAAQLAVNLSEYHGLTFTTATLIAAELLGVNHDNVRKYTRKALTGPTAIIKAKVTGPFAQLVGGHEVEEKRPLLVDVSPELNALACQTLNFPTS